MGTALTLVATAGALGVAGPAFADVTISPSSAPQGSGQNLAYHVVNDATQPITRVTLRIPADTPIAEVYPLSVDDWAPQIEWQELSTPLKTIHNGTPVTQVPKSITWIAVGGKAIAPGGAADLSVAVGPLPTLSTVQFTLVGTYADGKTGPAMTAGMTLTPDPDGAAAAAGHHGAAATEAASDEEQLFADTVAQAQDDDRGGSALAMGGWVVAALALIGAGWMVLRNRHRATEPDEPGEPEESPAPEATSEAPEPSEEKETVSASRWSYHG
ncbi:hypothetical protein GCM10010168_30400 [Actinoplanes ianthinogenes]|uniref:YncI copper-binding domain-containing protein n=1 Tax=Actinoplanes ianthinogenes TaxID=122358 RepID=A0ABM7LLT4_9ACTN|nr:DUF1775 domain-containing protein [Actinoplanes ianthinogenes]BCJ40182.1 hypothetical protein Aiant_08390 [Actinoplanes ianthinogenes]GGR10799.1 hypothetical protein GCM10010168_30400 [Actinoplanes ianthinogenes]